MESLRPGRDAERQRRGGAYTDGKPGQGHDRSREGDGKVYEPVVHSVEAVLGGNVVAQLYFSFLSMAS